MQAINRSRESLVAVGLAPPTWEELVSETAHPPHVADGEPNQPRVGWQAKAAREVESSFLANLRLILSDAEGAMLSPKVGHWPHLRSSASRRIAPLVWNHNFSGSCSFSQPVPADVAVLSTSLAIIGRPVLLLGRWDAEGSLSRMRPQESAERWEGCELTSSSETWIMGPVRCTKSRGRGGTDFPSSSKERSWQWTRHLSAP